MLDWKVKNRNERGHTVNSSKNFLQTLYISSYLHLRAKTLWPPVNNKLAHLWPTTQLQPALAWTPQILDGWPETDYSKCFSNGHKNLKYCYLVVFVLWAIASWHPKCVLSNWDQSVRLEYCEAIIMFLESINTIQTLWLGALSCWNIAFPVGKTDAMYGWNWSAVMLRYSVAFKVCSSTTTGMICCTLGK